jgi:hypothetical protein
LTDSDETIERRREDVLGKRLDSLREHMDARLNTQDSTMSGLVTRVTTIAERQKEHIETTGNWRDELQPVLDAYLNIQKGTRFVGHVSDFVAWLGTKAIATIAIVGTLAGAVAAWQWGCNLHAWKLFCGI